MGGSTVLPKNSSAKRSFYVLFLDILDYALFLDIIFAVDARAAAFSKRCLHGYKY